MNHTHDVLLNINSRIINGRSSDAKPHEPTWPAVTWPDGTDPVLPPADPEAVVVTSEVATLPKMGVPLATPEECQAPTDTSEIKTPASIQASLNLAWFGATEEEYIAFLKWRAERKATNGDRNGSTS